MNMKYVLGGALVVGVLVVGMSAMAEESRATKVPGRVPSPANVACVASAVAVREKALSVALSAQSLATQTAYTARASALATAYTKVSTTEIKTAVRDAWIKFGTDIKASSKTWKTSKNSAWSQYKVAVKACRDTSKVSDGDNSMREVSGE